MMEIWATSGWNCGGIQDGAEEAASASGLGLEFELS